MFKKILIANRGEIACRVMRSAKRLGIATVAVYSEADEAAVHVAMADEAVAIGPAAAAESYLRVDKILEAVRETGADAVHPGYGFLSENAAFAEELSKTGVTFIGPPPAAIAAMGDKIESKLLAAKAGVRTIPGHTEALDDVASAAKIAEGIGYPVMIKAAAGGGGKGMRLAWKPEELEEGVQSAINEAVSSFGDGRVFIEKFIEQPRHIEIQILADSQGNVIHLGERECSIQRRHQKVIEEAPSPLLDEATRAEMGAQACALARAVDYTSAGTVEFVADPARNFYFLEMNTRLQVEHPVTEMVTGLDLVEQQIRIAAGEPLALTQDEVKTTGWAMEARVYAEDPARGFAPSIGRLVRHEPPEETATVRLDTGVREGSEISMFYDPMIAKLVAHGDDREGAIDTMLDALDDYRISGISHNLGLLSGIMGHERFRDGRLTTAFLEEEFPDGFASAELTPEVLAVILPIAGMVHRRLEQPRSSLSGQLTARVVPPENDWVLAIGEDSHSLVVRDGADGAVQVNWNGQEATVETDWSPHERLMKARVNGVPVSVQVDHSRIRFTLRWRGVVAPVMVRTKRASELFARMPIKESPDLSRFLLSPMPGLVVSIPVSDGEEVKAGQTLAVVDAMKMENVLKAERDGKVAKVSVAQGDSLAVDQVIMEFE